MTVDIVTYANKSFGLFEQLIHNKFDVKIKVLGMGTKWNGYLDKSRGLVEYLKTKKDDDIVVYVDGFDSLVNRDPSDVEELFKKYDCKVLMSRNPIDPVSEVFGMVAFGRCGDSGETGSAGLFMGYAKELTQLLEDVLEMECGDDQVNMNTLCSKHDYIKVDKDEVIFKNYSPIRMSDESTDAIFVSFPGSPNSDRMFRSFVDYAQFFRWYFVALVLVVTLALPRAYKLIPVGIGILMFSMYCIFADRSCE
jgi:hypothetical protein